MAKKKAEVKEGESRVKAIKCECKSDYQDKVYGKYLRLHNKMINGKWRCTVCAAIKEG